MIPPEIENVRWFSHVGEPIELPLPRLKSWGDWPGPEDPRVETIHLRQQDLYDRLVVNDARMQALFAAVRDEVIAVASKRVEYDTRSDAWDPQSVATWHGAWTAALVACHRERKITLPSELEEQWSWFRRGHWPCAFATDPPEASNFQYVVF